ncbi:MAG: ferritin [Bacteroidales bacterium]
MISKKLVDALNEQITAEIWSANLYLSMSFYFQGEGYDGFAHWMKKQSEEETGHACRIADYIVRRGGTATVDKIDSVPKVWGSAKEVFKNVWEHECRVSKLIDSLVHLASEERDNATQDFLWGFVREQVEEEATAQTIFEKVSRVSDVGLFFLDSKLGERK